MGELTRIHLDGRESCPYLPRVQEVLTAAAMARYRGEYSVGFYEAALRYAQSLWLEGKSAQALLQLNKAFMAELDGSEEVLGRWPLPYAAKGWVMRHCPEGEFLGNPVRHYQHLATRMSGPRSELRTWRAWACLRLAEAVLPAGDHPRDEEQIAREDVVIPQRGEVLEKLAVLGLPGEAELVEGLLG